MNRFHTTVTALALGTTVLGGGAVLAASSANAATPDVVTAAVSDGSTTSDASASAASGPMSQAGAQGVRQWWRGLTDSQRSCLKDAGLTRPIGPLNDAERSALRSEVAAAAKTCGVELPFAKARAFWNSLTDTQRQCLTDAHLTRPLGPLSADERATLRADLSTAAHKCGITVPTQPAPAGS